MFPWVSIGGSVDLMREISGDVTAAAAALAGLLLVFLRSIAAACDAHLLRT